MAPLSLKAKGLGAAVAVYLLGQPIQCPFLFPELISDAVAMTTAQVGSAVATFGGAVGSVQAARHHHHHGRSFDLDNRAVHVPAPEGVPQYNFDQCSDSLTDPAVTVTVNGPVGNNGEQTREQYPTWLNQANCSTSSLSGVQIDGLPPACMVLSNVITGDVEGPVATPCGSACLLYNNLNNDQFSRMESTFAKLTST